MATYKQIPTISLSTYKLADECARLLWHGIDFTHGRNQASDAHLMDTFGRRFHNGIKFKRYIKFSLKEYSLLVRTARLNQFLKVERNEVTNTGKCITTSLIKIYKTNRYMSRGIKQNEQSTTFNYELGTAIARVYGSGNKSTTASRILFFLIPDRYFFNLNEKLAKELGMPRGSANFNLPLCQEIHRVLVRDWTILNQYKMPMRTSEIHEDIWTIAANGGWWERRVLDIAILLHYKITHATYARQIHAVKHKQQRPR